MSSSGTKDWFLTRSQDWEPGRILSLGQVILNPKNPGDAIFTKTTSCVSIPGDYIRDRSERKNVTIHLESKLNASFKLWGEINGAPLAGKLYGETKKESEAKWLLKKLETETFLPDLEYVEKILKAGDVPTAIKWWKLRRRIFLVTGVRIARGATISASDVDKSSVGGALKGDGSTQNIPAKGGFDVNMGHDTKQVETVEESSDFVFAYRLHEINWIAGLDKKAYTDGDTQAISDDDAEKLNPDELADEEDEDESITGYELDGLKLVQEGVDMVE
jgi:hypothetical protein